MTIEIVDFPIENGGSFHSYVSLPECIQAEFKIMFQTFRLGDIEQCY